MIQGDALWTRGQQESGACRPSLNEMIACVVLGFKELQGSPSWDPGAFDWSLAQVIGDVNLEGTLRGWCLAFCWKDSVVSGGSSHSACICVSEAFRLLQTFPEKMSVFSIGVHPQLLKPHTPVAGFALETLS